MIKKFWAMPVVVLALNAAVVGAAPRASRVEVTPVSTYESASLGRNALGFRYYNGYGFLHGTYGLDDKNSVGFGFGAASDFDSIGILGNFRHTLVSRGAASLFGEGALSFVKVGTTKPFTILASFGFDYGLTDNLHASFGYGLGVAFGSGVTDHFSTTQSSFHGNFGLEWRL